MNAPVPQDVLDAGARRERQSRLVQALSSLLPAHALLYRREDTVPYECDGLTAYRALPMAVALPETEAQVAAVLKACHALAVPVVARGAGTGLSGGAMPHEQGVTLSLARFNKIVQVDALARTAVSLTRPSRMASNTAGVWSTPVSSQHARKHASRSKGTLCPLSSTPGWRIHAANSSQARARATSLVSPSPSV